MRVWNTSANWGGPLTRRAALRGAGAVLALPFLESWAARLARAAGAPPRQAVKPPLRFGIYTVTGGTVSESWKCPADGPLPAELPSILRPLAFARDELLLVTGLAQKGDTQNLEGHEPSAFTHLTAAARCGRQGGKPYASISVDQAAARAAGGETYLPSLEFGLPRFGPGCFSFRSADEMVPYEADPRLVFDRMFRGRPPVVPNWQRRAAAGAGRAVRSSAPPDSYDRSVVDAVRDEAKALRGRLAAADRQKLDRYLDTVRSVEGRIDRLEERLRVEAADLKSPGPSALVRVGLPPRDLRFGAYRDLVHADSEKHAEYIRTMSDLLVLAFQTDTTRVATLAVGSDDAMFQGVVTVGYEFHAHTLQHNGGAADPAEADPVAREALRQTHTWYTGLFAEAVRKMKAIDEGGSTLLDNCMLLYTSYMATGGHGTEDYPALLAGRAGGTLRTGRQVSFPARTPMANLYVEILDRMGAEVKEFGDSHAAKGQRFGGRLPGLV